MSPETLRVLGFSLGVAALATALIIPPGYALAWLLARKQWRGKTLVESLVVFPLVLPPVATGLFLLYLLGARGPLGGLVSMLGAGDILFTGKAVVLASAVMAFPLLVRTARVAFAGVDPRLEQVASTLGAGRARVAWTITVPLAAPGLAAAAVLAFARALGEFGATIMVAGYIPGETATLALSIYQQVQLGRDAAALGLAGLSLLLAFAAVALGEFIVRRARR
ncbi:MAG: molybdate ABC transporter permease subunit [Verrucomicrobia bacterium]|nr:molybdate ABC transporter permease subunit [Verrucomicrobiota bacterium]